ncbi:MAG: MgtC/SapB family protein [Evtepia gabavorous]
MIQLDWMGSLRDLNVLSVCVRLLLAMAFGGTIGFERGIRQRAAGLRTHMLLCVGAASTMLVSQYIYASYGVGDPARLSAQVISGIGFLGAGTIIVTRRNQIKGADHGGNPWATACMGLAVGVGFYECALAMYVILIFILLLVNVVDTKYLKSPPVQRSIWRSGGMSGWETPSISSTRSAGAFERSKNSPPGALTSWQCGWIWNQNRLCAGTSPPWFCSKSRRVWSVWKCDVQQV